MPRAAGASSAARSCSATPRDRHGELTGDRSQRRDAKATARAYLESVALTLGDVGFVDADGFVFLCDRKSNVVISGGVNIHPAEIEQVLIAHPAVADVAVLGIPDEEWGESLRDRYWQGRDRRI